MTLYRPDTAFPLDRGQRRPRRENPDHLAFVRTLPCLIPGCYGAAQAAHVRYGSIPHGKRQTGAGEKPSDCWTVPLCEAHHLFGPDAQHTRGEHLWWMEEQIDPLVIAALLFANSGNHAAGVSIVRHAKDFNER